jgi:hypothetical protein
MKRSFAVLALMLCAALAGAQQASTSKHINWGWNQSNANAPVCADATSKSCGISYQLTLTDPTGKVGTPITIPWPATSYAYGPGGFLYCGDWKASITLKYQDDQAVTQTTPAITGTGPVTCPFVLSPPSGLAGTPAP